MDKMPRVLLIAGEASGDVHGAALVHELKKLSPQIEVSGIGGDHLRAAGMETVIDTAEMATMGIVEVFGTAGRIISAYRQLVRIMKESRPSLLILIDYPEFNLVVAKKAKSLGIPVFYYIAPQVWAWRRGRIQKIADRVDRLAAVFPFEAELYNEAASATGKHETVARFVGHPLLDRVQEPRATNETLELHQLDPNRPLLAILPGSRKKELRALLPTALSAAAILEQEGWQAVIALAHTLDPGDVREILGHEPTVPIVERDTANIVHAATSVACASGTATLETALQGKAMVIMYRVSPLTFAIAKRLVHVPYIGMPNIILDRPVFPELIQDELSENSLADALRKVSETATTFHQAAEELRTKLGEPGGSRRAAELALELIK